MIAFILPAILLEIGLAWPRLVLGEAARALPMIALPFVLLAARRAPDPRYRVVSIATGLAVGLLYEGAFLVPAIILLGLGAFAHGTRLVLRLERAGQRLVFGLVLAALDALGRGLVAGDGGLFGLGREGIPWAGIGVFATALVYVFLEGAIDRLPRWRHLLQRPWSTRGPRLHAA